MWQNVSTNLGIDDQSSIYAERCGIWLTYVSVSAHDRGVDFRDP